MTEKVGGGKVVVVSEEVTTRPTVPKEDVAVMTEAERRLFMEKVERVAEVSERESNYWDR
jgi:hypothetical protein